MKTSKDPRHLRRRDLMQELFTWNYQKDSSTKLAVSLELQEIVDQIPTIDKYIGESAPEWPIANINKIDLAILRLAVFELIMKKDAPYKVTVDEAVELGKEFGSESSPGFINGVLGKIIASKGIDVQSLGASVIRKDNK